MTITEVRRPYEFLVRWNQDGVLSGAHIGFRNVIYKDGAILTETVEPVQPVAAAGNAGFPLADILSQIEADALIAREQAVQALATANAAHAAALAEKDAQIAALQAQLKA